MSFSGAAGSVRWSPLTLLRSDQRWPIALLIGVLLALLMLPPLWILLQDSVTTTNAIGNVTGFTLAHFRRLVTDKGALTSVWNTLVFAGGSTVLSLITGGILAWLVERTNAPLKVLAYLATIISMGTPYILHVIAWLFLLGKVGPLNEGWRALTGANGNLFEVNSMAGMILIEGLLWSPLVFLLLGATFRAANADMEEAARMSGATVFDTLRRVSVPLAMPAILALALFVFIRAIGGFEVPALVGMPGRIFVLSTDVYEATIVVPPDLGYAAAFSVIMVAIVAVLLYFYGRLSKNAERYHSVTGKGYRPRPFDLGGWRWLAGAIIVANFCIVLLLPLLTLLWLSLLPFMRAFSVAALPTLTLRNYRTVLQAGGYLDLALNSLTVAAGAATAIMLIAMLAGWIAARRGPGGRILDQLAMLSLVFPGICLGVAVMEVYLRVPLPIYGTLWIIAIAYVIRYMPYGMRYVYSGVLQLHRELEEAAGVSGASALTTLKRVVAPLLTPALAAGWLFIFLIANKELAIAVLLASPGSQVIAVAIFDAWTNGQGGELAAFGLIWTALMTVIAFVFFMQMRRGATDVYGA
ncbi:MAG TPA: iron ABC transporter permease [Stellaceae bacterium]|jgi:iron(III) transport system permease protein|nr:iron ABC transporter permease [Stellaceae bacterium]